MKLTPLILLLGCVLWLPAAPSVELAFAPGKGDRIRTRLERSLALDLAEETVKIVVDGEEEEVERTARFRIEIRETETIAFTDDIEELAEGRVAVLRRTFDEVGTVVIQTITDPDGDSFEDEVPGTSELESKAVRFRWDGETEEYEAGFDDDFADEDESLLEDLEAVADFSWFLPDEEVEKGDTWKIEIEAFEQLSSLSGDVKITREDDEEGDEVFQEQFVENLEGEMAGELTGFREAGDARLAVIHVTAELSTEVVIEAVEELDGRTADVTETFRFEFDLDGDLLWDLESGRAHAFRIGGVVEMAVNGSQSLTENGRDVAFVRTQRFEGSVDYDVSVTEPTR